MVPQCSHHAARSDKRCVISGKGTRKCKRNQRCKSDLLSKREFGFQASSGKLHAVHHPQNEGLCLDVADDVLAKDKLPQQLISDKDRGRVAQRQTDELQVAC